MVPAGEADCMQVPSDLASRLSRLALTSGRSPEALLREAIIHLVENAAQTPTAETLAALNETPHLHTGFAPRPQSFSVYE